MEELSPWQQWKQNLGESRPWDFIKPSTEYVEKEVSDLRMSICQQCPSFLKATSQCKLCGCLMVLKTKLNHATCPAGKW